MGFSTYKSHKEAYVLSKQVGLVAMSLRGVQEILTTLVSSIKKRGIFSMKDMERREIILE